MGFEVFSISTSGGCLEASKARAEFEPTMEHACRPHRLRSVDGPPSALRVSQMCRALPRQLQIARIFLPRSVPLSCVRAVDLSRESPRHRSLSAFVPSKLYHMGFRGNVSRSTLADANEAHDWRIFADFAQVLIHIARPMYANESLGLGLDNTVYALDSTTIDLCLSVFPWARFRATKAAIKLHTLLDLRGPIPTFIEVSEGKLHDVNILDTIV